MLDIPPILELINHLESMKRSLQAAWETAKRNNNKGLCRIIAVTGSAINDQLEEYQLTDTIHYSTYLTIETRTAAILKLL
jgi:hypothetical protein